MAASSAASALAFDAGGRRFDIWVGDMTEKEASELLKMHEHESAATAIIDNCAVAGNASGFCQVFFECFPLLREHRVPVRWSPRW